MRFSLYIQPWEESCELSIDVLSDEEVDDKHMMFSLAILVFRDSFHSRHFIDPGANTQRIEAIRTRLRLKMIKQTVLPESWVLEMRDTIQILKWMSVFLSEILGKWVVAQYSIYRYSAFDISII